MKPLRIVASIALLALLISCSPPQDTLPGAGDDEGQTVVYRDTWGVPHIYSPTVAGGLYAMGYTQAQDRPSQLLQNVLIAIGEYASVVGAPAVPSDLRSHMWDHLGAGRRAMPTLDPELVEHLEAFARGMNDFYRDHPEDVPDWWGDREIDGPMLLAFGRLFLYNWSIDEAYGDLGRGGIDPGYEPDQRGSNQFDVAPERSALGVPILAIDPHLSWTGPSRFWEFRIHAGELVGSGVTLTGSPYIGLGHNRHVAWAMTTGGPDTADVYELTLEPGSDPPRYRYDDEWRELTSREVTLNVAGEDAQTHTLWFSHHGPIIARHGDVAYAGKIAYGDLVTLEAWKHLAFATSYEGVKDALATLTVFPQNVMAADTSGNIYYQRTGRVPVRPDGYDWSTPVDGSTSASEWQGVHSAEDHLQLLNPAHGYMQNCNIPPDAMMKNSPLQPELYEDYLFSGPGYGPARSGWTNQRGARAVELLHIDDSVTLEEAMAYINDVQPFGIARWIVALREANELAGSTVDQESYAAALEALLLWNRELTADSSAALIYDTFRRRLRDTGLAGADVAAAIDDYYAFVADEDPKPVELSQEQAETIVASLAAAAGDLVQAHGSLDATYGDVHRVGRGDESWPVGGGGGRHGTTTLRNMGYSDRDDGTRWGRSGQTSTQVVVLSDPPESYLYLPLGQSDREDSEHFDDQAEKLFSSRELKPSWWLPEDLAPNVVSRTVLDGAP